MVLAEILIETKNLEKRIDQLMNYVNSASSSSSDATDRAIKKLLSLLDKHRSHLILINRVNNEVTVSVGDSQLSLANAIIILNTINEKISMLDSLIESDNCVLDIVDVMEQRDKLLDEYTAISKEIQYQEWRIEIDKEIMG